MVKLSQTMMRSRKALANDVKNINIISTVFMTTKLEHVMTQKSP